MVQYILDIGIKIKGDLDMVNDIGQMVQNILDNGKIIKLTVMED